MSSSKKFYSSRDQLNENDADDSDTDSLSDQQIRKKMTPKRSATVSPAARHRFRHNRSTYRRRSDVYLGATDSIYYPGLPRGRLSVEKIGMYAMDQPLRKTNSEPSVEQQQKALTLDAIRSLMESYQTLPQKLNDAAQDIDSSPLRMNNQQELLEIWSTPRQSIVSEDEEEDLMNTDIEELKDAVESIQSLQRVLKLPNQHSSSKNEISSMNSSTDSTGTMKGITTNLRGHPRGVMQFLPSAKHNNFQPTLDSYTWNKEQNENFPLLQRKTSVPENYLKLGRQSVDKTSSLSRPKMRIIRSSDTEPDIFSTAAVLNNKTADSLAGVNRFSKLLNSLRGQRQTTEQWPYQTNLLLPPDANGTKERQVQQQIMQADQLLWKRRSRASLRRHQEIRNMAVRELFETERTFVESLEYLMQKYMRPLKQPLECTLIEPHLLDRIFYKIPEILAHHQVLYAALTTRMESLQNDSIIGDVLLAHFTKQSMIETFIAFVDNFKNAKQSIWEARQRPAFEKYYMRCSREHRTKLDLDSLLILPIQRVPRYELILKQILKHTSVDHCDYDKLLLVQKHVHQLAVIINCQREETEKMEQRLREIEAIVDGLDDLVSADRTFIRYDVVTVKDSKNKNKLRCIFMMSDQLIVTCICKNIDSTYNIQYYNQSTDFLDNNRFKLLIKISLDDVDISQDTIPLLQSVEEQIKNAHEDVNILSKIIDLSKLIKTDHITLTELLGNMYSTRSNQVKQLQEQMTSNPDLTTVNLKVTTFDGIETLTIQFANAEKRSVWENAFLEAKNALKNAMQIKKSPPTLKSILIHKARNGLTFSAVSPSISKSSENSHNVWICSSDKFSGQVAILNADNEPSVESSSNLGNSAITSICSVPPPRKIKLNNHHKEKNNNEMELDSSSSEVENSESEASMSSLQSTIWIGNDDGEIYIFNYLDNVRFKSRERVVRLSMSIVQIAYLEEQVFVSLSNKTQNQLISFSRKRENTWDLDKPRQIKISSNEKISCMTAVTNRLCLGCQNSILLLNPHEYSVEKSTTLSNSTDEVGYLVSLGSIIYASMKKSTTVIMLNAFTLERISEFSISSLITRTLSSKDDIIKNHKLGNLRITALLCVRNQLWIGSSAGVIISTPVIRTKSAWSPNFHVCTIGHIGPCRFLTSVNVCPLTTNSLNNRKMSLNAASLQQNEQVYVISGGNGVDNYEMENNNDETGADDSCNHLIFWQI